MAEPTTERADARHRQRLRAQSIDTPYSRPTRDNGDKPDQLDADLRYEGARQERLLDESLEETFPASDPISPARAD